MKFHLKVSGLFPAGQSTKTESVRASVYEILYSGSSIKELEPGVVTTWQGKDSGPMISKSYGVSYE